MSNLMEDVEEVTDLRDPDTVTKYKAAAQIANQVLAEVVAEVKPGVKIVDLCAFGDRRIEEEAQKLYQKKVDGKPVLRGVASPTCVSVNEIVGSFSPLKNDTTTLQEGDLVKIDLGAHIDGMMALVGHTVVASNTVGKVADQPITGRDADLIAACYYASECALRMLRPGNKGSDITKMISTVAESFGVKPVEETNSHQISQFSFDQDKMIPSVDVPENKIEEVIFEENQVYMIDIVMSTGEGKTREKDAVPTVFCRDPDARYMLKMKASRQVFSEITNKFPRLPFSLRALDTKSARLGMKEITQHDLVFTYPVLYEKPGERVAQIKFTALILPTIIDRITAHGLPFVKSDKELTDPQLLNTFKMGVKRKSKAQIAKQKRRRRRKKKANNANANADMQTD